MFAGAFLDQAASSDSRVTIDKLTHGLETQYNLRYNARHGHVINIRKCMVTKKEALRLNSTVISLDYLHVLHAHTLVS